VLAVNISEKPSATDLCDALMKAEVQEFFGKPLQRVFVEGGPRLLSFLFSSNMIDAYHAFVAPTLLGGSTGRIQQSPPLALASSRFFQPLASFPLATDTVMEGIANPKLFQDLG